MVKHTTDNRVTVIQFNPRGPKERKIKMLIGEVTYISNFRERYFIIESNNKEYKCKTDESNWDKLYDYLSKPIRVAVINKFFKQESMDWIYTVAII